jgi:hypothetical protein
MPDINKIRFSGTIERLKSVNTKTGTTMTTLLLKVGQDKFKCIAFKNVADAILKLRDEDQISVTGSGSINSWKDNEDRWRNDFQVSVWEVEIDGSSVKYEKNTDTGGRPNKNTELPPPQQHTQDMSQYDHKGGPF